MMRTDPVANLRRAAIAGVAAVLGSLTAAAQTGGPALHVSVLRVDDDPRPLIAAGQTVTLSVGVSNLRGEADAHATVLTVMIPAGLKLDHSRPALDRSEAADGGQRVVWNLNTVPAGAFPHIFEVDLTAGADVKAGASLPVTATVTSSDSAKQTNGAFFIVVQPPAADVAVRCSLESVPITLGGTVEFSVDVGNWGNIPAAASALTLTLPSEVKFKSADPPPDTQSGNIVRWQLGDIAPAATRTIVVTVVPDLSLANGSDARKTRLKFMLDGSTTTVQAEPAHAHLEIDKAVERAGSALKVWLSVQDAGIPGELPIGKDVIYTITYGNFGNAPAQHALVSLSLAGGLNPVRAEPVAAATSRSDRFKGGVLSWDAGELAAGQTNIIKSTVHVASVPEDGSLVMASVAAAADSNVAYSLRHRPLVAAAGHAVVARGSRNILLWLLVFLVPAVVWMVLRMRR